jgi:hypothetical protein
MHDHQRTMVLQTVLIPHLCSSFVPPRTRMLTKAMPLERPRSHPPQVTGAKHKGDLKITTNKAFAVLPQPTTEYMQVRARARPMCDRWLIVTGDDAGGGILSSVISMLVFGGMIVVG